MKKGILFMAFAVAVAFTSCSKDEDKDCETCDVEGVEIEICENSDGSLTITTDGESQTISEDDLGGITAASYKELICSLNSLSL